VNGPTDVPVISSSTLNSLAVLFLTWKIVMPLTAVKVDQLAHEAVVPLDCLSRNARYRRNLISNLWRDI
jgi:hypothetical protein